MKKKHLLMLGTAAAVFILAVTTSLVGCKGDDNGDDQEVIEINPSDFNISDEGGEEESESDAGPEPAAEASFGLG